MSAPTQQPAPPTEAERMRGDCVSPDALANLISLFPADDAAPLPDCAPDTPMVYILLLLKGEETFLEELSDGQATAHALALLRRTRAGLLAMIAAAQRAERDLRLFSPDTEIGRELRAAFLGLGVPLLERRGEGRP